MVQSLQKSCFDANIALGKSGLVDMTFGNVSVFDNERGVLAIKPSGVPYEAMRPEDMVLLNLDGTIILGPLRPSSDAPTHRYLYREFHGIRAIVHTHSRNAVAFAQAERSIPCLGTTHADFFNGDVPITRKMTDREIIGPYEWETGKVIVECFREQKIDPLAVPSVLVAKHGPFCWGNTAEKAVETASALEIVAEMAFKTLSLNPSATGLVKSQKDQHFFRKHGKDAYYGQS